jgi:ankyrin repeat protein
MCPTRKLENDNEDTKRRNIFPIYAISLLNAIRILDEINDPLVENLSILHKAAKYGNKSLIDYFVKHENYDVNMQSGSKRLTPLHIAAMVSNFETLKALIDNGANILLETSSKTNALQYVGLFKLIHKKIKHTFIRENENGHFVLNTDESTDQREQACLNLLIRNALKL